MSDGVPVAVVDVLSSLSEAESASIFRHLDASGPYLDRAHARLRRPLEQMFRQSHRHARELDALIASLGGSPPRAAPAPEEQYLAYLSFKFLLPKLADAKALCVQRHRNALAAIESTAPDEATDMLRTHLADHEADLKFLNDALAADEATGGATGTS